MLTDWNPLLRQQFARPYWAELQGFIQAERRVSDVYPPDQEVYAALHRTAYTDVKVLILGQDPYHGDKQAHGLCFSVQRGVPIPPSLRNIHKELHSDLGLVPPNHGNLETWAQQGVLLLNAVLTVRAGNAGHTEIADGRPLRTRLLGWSIRRTSAWCLSCGGPLPKRKSH